MKHVARRLALDHRPQQRTVRDEHLPVVEPFPPPRRAKTRRRSATYTRLVPSGLSFVPVPLPAAGGIRSPQLST